MPNIEVKCSVSNCFFYEQGNNCGAPSIMVEVDQHSYNEEYGNELGIQTNHIDVAKASKNTCCRTFKPKNNQ